MNLQYRMILDYTARVERLHLGKHPTKLTVDVANYIQHHMSYYFQIQLRHLLAPFPFWRPLIPLSVALLRCISLPLARTKNSRRILAHSYLEIVSELITAEKIAEELFLSRPYLSRKFKEETGESLTDFILKEKTEEAKRLLRYSDKSLTAIGSYLGFSSASHFSRVFKTYVGSTPSEYREKHQ